MAAGELSRVTAIEPQKGRAGRVSVFVDGEFALGLDAEVAAGLGFRIGLAVTEATLCEAATAEARHGARASALRYLGYRARSREELRRRLRQKGYDEPTVEDVVSWLDEHGLLDDARFSREWVEARTSARPMGRRRLAWELHARGVGGETVSEALASRDEETEVRLALQVARRVGARNRESDRSAYARRIAATLQRRGFSWSVVRQVLRELLGTEPDDCS